MYETWKKELHIWNSDIILVQNLHLVFLFRISLSRANHPLIHRKFRLIAVKVSLKLSSCALLQGLEIFGQQANATKNSDLYSPEV